MPFGTLRKAKSDNRSFRNSEKLGIRERVKEKEKRELIKTKENGKESRKR